MTTTTTDEDAHARHHLTLRVIEQLTREFGEEIVTGPILAWPPELRPRWRQLREAWSVSPDIPAEDVAAAQLAQAAAEQQLIEGAQEANRRTIAQTNILGTLIEELRADAAFRASIDGDVPLREWPPELRQRITDRERERLAAWHAAGEPNVAENR